MTEDDKALVERLREEADEWDEPKSHDEFDMRGLLHSAADRIEALSAKLTEAEALLDLQNQDIGRLRDSVWDIVEDVLADAYDIGKIEAEHHGYLHKRIRAALGETK